LDISEVTYPGRYAREALQRRIYLAFQVVIKYDNGNIGTEHFQYGVQVLQ